MRVYLVKKIVCLATKSRHDRVGTQQEKDRNDYWCIPPPIDPRRIASHPDESTKYPATSNRRRKENLGIDVFKLSSARKNKKKVTHRKHTILFIDKTPHPFFL